jgi:HNH endonuclease
MDPKLRLLVRTRADHRCEYCGIPQEFSELRFHIEHIIPRQHGGIDDAENLALACPDCNLRKGPNLSGLDPDTGEIVRLFHPRRDLWAEHFVYKGVHIIGTTPTARATASLLAVNDPERLRIRRVTAQIYK